MHLNVKTVLFQIIQVSISGEFQYQTVLCDLLREPFQVLPLQARVNLGAIAIKGYSGFLKDPALLKLHHQIV